MFFWRIQLIRKYINFRLKSKPRGGHGIHSPFVYDLYTNCIDISSKEAIFEKIESFRKELQANGNQIPNSNFGAGSKVINSTERTVSEIVKTSSIKQYTGRLLYRLVKYLKPQTIVELGTSTGFSAMYLASGYENAKVISIEGDINLANLANQNFNKLGLTNVTSIIGDFDKELPDTISVMKRIDLVFIDGNHSEEATLKYFNILKEKAGNDSVIIFDDIRWSIGMEKAWNTICQYRIVTISIDLFNCGMLFFRNGIVKQHFNLRYGPF